MTINFNEGGRFLTFAVNLSNLRFYIAVAIPYLWYGEHRPPNRDVLPVTGWYIRYKILSMVIYKPKEKNER